MSYPHTSAERTDALVLDRSEDFYEQRSALFSTCRTYRYALTRQWDQGLPPAVFVMLNPSTADAFILDPTVRRCVSFAREWGCGGVVVLNLFALRSTDPTGLYSHPDPVGPDNDQVIAEHIALNPGARMICAWGVHGAFQDRAQHVAEVIRNVGDTPMCLGVTKEGHPRHPLYVAGATPLVEFHPEVSGA